VSPVRYELGFLSQKTPFFIVPAVKTANLTTLNPFVLRQYTRQIIKALEADFAV
jgi:hypothetical protein